MTFNVKNNPLKPGGRIVTLGSGGGLKTKFATSAASIVTSGLVMHLDAGNPASYPGSGTTWTDLTGNSNNASLYGGWSYDSANGGRIIFDGVNGYAPLYSARTGFPFGSSPGSISGWGKDRHPLRGTLDFRLR